MLTTEIKKPIYKYEVAFSNSEIIVSKCEKYFFMFGIIDTSSSSVASSFEVRASIIKQYALLLSPLLDKLPLLDNTRCAEGLRRVIIFISVIRQYAPLVQELLDNTRCYCRRY